MKISHRDERFAKGKLWKSIKTGDTYVTAGGEINTTNSSDGMIMVRYFEGRDSFLHYLPFTREASEFLQKFEPILEAN